MVFPESFRFRHQWRAYQQRVLDELDRHLGDDHFHISAAPGAGKTVLGLEAMRRLQRPSLVLVPTVAIREQWALRLQHDFLASAEPPRWLSRDLERPTTVTLTTYQALYAACKRLGLNTVVNRLRAADVQTLVLDEAHHLRRQWWQCLIKLKAALPSPRMIALTGTPPFDVPQSEWNRYIALCGPIDAEISTPELVQAGNLCPHQDYIHFSRPSDVEQASLDRFDRQMRQFLTEMLLDQSLIDLLRAHPVVCEPAQHMGALNERSDYVFALLLFLHATAPEHSRPLLCALDLSEVRLPAFDLDWAEVLLNGVLFDRDAWLPSHREPLPRLARSLRRLGALRLRRVHTRTPPQLQRALERSQNKLNSISEIIELEVCSRPILMRALVLCDQLRAGDLPQPGDAEAALQHLGVVPVFERLRRLRLPDVRLAVLSGSLVIAPAAVTETLSAHLVDLGLNADRCTGIPLWHDTAFHRFDIEPGSSGSFVAALTALFEKGELNLLIGTTALLGEGWDAPSLDTLVLATAVRSSMLSNQMRGRALRCDPRRPDKSANIWHLACLRPGGSKETETQTSADFLALGQRFRTFVGVARHRPQIENGLDRLNLDRMALNRADCDRLNAGLCAAALDRLALRSAWHTALFGDHTARDRLVMELRVPQRRLALTTVLRRGARWSMVWGLRWLYALLLRRHFERLAGALLAAMKQRGLISAPEARVEVSIVQDEARARLREATLHDETPFSEALRELFDPPQNPRYLIRMSEQYYAVPACLGDKREHAEGLQRGLAQVLGRCELIYTRSDSGKRVLLQAKEHWLLRRFQSPCESRLLWG